MVTRVKTRWHIAILNEYYSTIKPAQNYLIFLVLEHIRDIVAINSVTKLSQDFCKTMVARMLTNPLWTTDGLTDAEYPTRNQTFKGSKLVT